MYGNKPEQVLGFTIQRMKPNQSPSVPANHFKPVGVQMKSAGEYEKYSNRYIRNINNNPAAVPLVVVPLFTDPRIGRVVGLSVTPERLQ